MSHGEAAARGGAAGRAPASPKSRAAVEVAAPASAPEPAKVPASGKSPAAGKAPAAGKSPAPSKRPSQAKAPEPAKAPPSAKVPAGGKSPAPSKRPGQAKAPEPAKAPPSAKVPAGGKSSAASKSPAAGKSPPSKRPGQANTSAPAPAKRPASAKPPSPGKSRATPKPSSPASKSATKRAQAKSPTPSNKALAPSKKAPASAKTPPSPSKRPPRPAKKPPSPAKLLSAAKLPAPAHPAAPAAHALLSALPAAFSAPVQHSPGARPYATRSLTLAGHTLLLCKPGAPTPRLLPLHPASDPRPRGPRTALLTPPCPLRVSALYAPVRLRFASPRARDAFVAAARRAVRHRADAPARYHPLRELGRGASGVVYMARSGDKAVALKAVQKDNVLKSPPRLTNLVGERTLLQKAAERDSPFLLKLVDAFETRRFAVFVTELAAFGDLRSVLTLLPGQRVPESVARGLFADAALGLEELHRAGFLHRDLKLGNMLLSEHGRVMLADFGLSKQVCQDEARLSWVTDEEGARLAGKATSFVGTKRYMSPELVYSKEGYGAPADLWALGVSLYLMLVGQYPFGHLGKTRRASAIFDAIESDSVAYPSWLSPEAADLLRGLLERDEALRFGLPEVLNHPWLGGVDFVQARGDASAGTPREDVLTLLRKHDVRRVDAVMRGEMPLDCSDVVSDLSSSSDGWRRRSSGSTDELLGFAFVSGAR